MYTKLKWLCIFMIFWMQACDKQNRMEKQEKTDYGYNVTVTAPKEYPVEVHEGWLMDDKKQFICAMPKAGSTTGSWGYDGAEAGQAGNKIPYHLNLTYVAYAEKKFYTVDADLPMEKILEEFSKGFSIEGDPDENKIQHIEHGTYNTFTIGAAPGGVIVVFLSAGHHRVEICRLQAKEVFVDRNNFYDNPHARTQQGFFDTMFEIAVPKTIQESIKEKGIPYGLWDKYREKFRYRFVFKPYDGKDKFTFESHRYFNGETNLFYPQDLDKNEYITAAIPYNVNLSFTQYNTEITFDDQEMLKVFGDFKKSDPEKPLDIIIKPTFEYNDMKISVKCGDKEIPLQKYKVEGVWSNN
ncbi:DUF2931 family protein [Chryseobacterium sp. Leaf405]|uniref:DUF2931 family protein n=1 Tax=Chryseobacterium sp. Leaf405 TaxID=1736367 RepID=UPI0009E8D20E|nr:DUF2931 family protein [Chryseobacterium sp. Leaf405]